MVTHPSTVADVRRICLSVCPSISLVCHTAQFGLIAQDRLNGSRCSLGWTLLGAMEHCVTQGSWSPTVKGRGSCRNLYSVGVTWPTVGFWDCLVSLEQLKLETWNNKNYANVDRIEVWVMWPTFNFCLHISETAADRQSWMWSVCGAFDAAFAKLLWPLALVWEILYRDCWSKSCRMVR